MLKKSVLKETPHDPEGDVIEDPVLKVAFIGCNRCGRPHGPLPISYAKGWVAQREAIRAAKPRRRKPQ